MTDASSERRKRPRPSDSPALSARERRLVDVAIELTLDRLGVTDLDDFRDQQQAARESLRWFRAMREREIRSSEFWRKVGGDIATELIKWVAKSTAPLCAAAGGYAIFEWARHFHETGGPKAP